MPGLVHTVVTHTEGVHNDSHDQASSINTAELLERYQVPSETRQSKSGVFTAKARINTDFLSSRLPSLSTLIKSN